VKYRDALAASPDLARGHHGMGEGARGAQPADRSDERSTRPRCGCRPATSKSTTRSARLRTAAQIRGAAAAYSNYVNLLPNKESQATRRTGRVPKSASSARSGSACRFESDPGTDDKLYTVDFRLLNEKGRRARQVNDAAAQDFVVDTGAENTVITLSDGAAPRHHAGHLYAQRGRRPRRAARPSARPDRLARARLAQAAQRSRA